MRFDNQVLSANPFTQKQLIVVNIAKASRCPILHDFPPEDSSPPPSSDAPLSEEEMLDWKKTDCCILDYKIYSRSMLMGWFNYLQGNERDGLSPTANADRSIRSIFRDGTNLTSTDILEAPHTVPYSVIEEFVRRASGWGSDITSTKIRHILEEEIGLEFQDELNIPIIGFVAGMKTEMDHVQHAYDSFLVASRNQEQSPPAPPLPPPPPPRELRALPNFINNAQGQELLRIFMVTARQWPADPEEPDGPSGYAVTLAHNKKTSWLQANLPFFFQDGIFQGFREVNVASFVRQRFNPAQ